MARAMEPFGLVYYGCCEPSHGQIETIGDMLPHLRKISVTPWARYDQCAREIGGRYVYSAKANPANVAFTRLNEDTIREELRVITRACEENGCNYEIVLKDISTVAGQPGHLDRRAQIAEEFIHD